MYWYRLPRFTGPVAQIREQLEPMGITTKAPLGRAYYWVHDEDGPMKDIGDLIVRSSGRIEVWPYNGIDDRDMRALYGSADEAFRVKPSAAANWHFRRLGKGKSFWRCTVCLPVSDSDPMRSVMMACRTTENVEGSTDATIIPMQRASA